MLPPVKFMTTELIITSCVVDPGQGKNLSIINKKVPHINVFKYRKLYNSFL